MSFFVYHTKIFVLVLLILFLIDIFHLKEASRFHCIWVVTAGSLRGAKQRGNLMTLQKHYEVTTLSAIVRDELHPLRLPSTANLTRELFRLIKNSSFFLRKSWEDDGNSCIKKTKGVDGTVVFFPEHMVVKW